MADVFLRRLSRWQAEQHREQLADLHVAAYATDSPCLSGRTAHAGGRQPAAAAPAEEPFHGRAAFLRRLAGHSVRPGFDLVVADGGGVVGCAYGFPLERQSGRWRGFVGPVPEHLAELTLAGRVFAVAELMVLPRLRRRGIGRRLHDQLLAGSDAALAALVLDPDHAGGAPAHAACRAWGWSPAGRFRPAERGPELEVYTRPLRR
ncbi:GNAT family N-acetyltransferase [Streptomyces gamaensis]|uniref:GNAT family N-acetyltransferase n=1 Tax=Streptomyces gamaensis TaxID=1763542 RepID=A0ABW0YZ14_9ACTN